jgi:hypothetical protein
MLRSACITFLAIVLLPATVQAFDHDHHHHGSHHDSGCGSSDHSSSPSPSSPGSAPTDHPTTTTTPQHKRVFVTSQTYSGALGGLDGADAYCQTSAREHGLSGTYRAWLSGGTTDAFDRVVGDGPWVNTAGQEVFASKAAMREAPLADLRDEVGQEPVNIATVGAWSGSDAEGGHTGSDCAAWTDATDGASASMGSTLAADPSWGGGDAPAKCSTKAPLICYEQ